MLRVINPNATQKHDFGGGLIVEFRNLNVMTLADIQEELGKEDDKLRNTLTSLNVALKQVIHNWEGVVCDSRGVLTYEEYKDKIHEVFDLKSMNEILTKALQLNGLSSEEEGN